MRVWAQSSQRSTWPPRIAERQASIADMTRNCPRLRCPALSLRHASPWRRKISATSSFGRDIPAALCRRGALNLQGIKRALHLADDIDRDARIARCGVDVAMAQQILDDADIHTLLQEMGGEAMPERVHG